MDEFGWILFGLGILLLVVFGVIGMDTGDLKVANLSGMIAGMSCMVSGAVIGIGGRIEKRMPKSEIQIAEASGQTKPVEITAPKLEYIAPLSPKANFIAIAVIIGIALIFVFASVF
jgi:hypothetical protein